MECTNSYKYTCHSNDWLEPSKANEDAKWMKLINIKRLAVIVSPKSSTIAEINFINVRIGWYICEMCAIAVECISFVWICFGWMLWWRWISGLNTLLQCRHIILRNEEGIPIYICEWFVCVCLFVCTNFDGIDFDVRKLNIWVANLWYDVTSGRSYLIQVTIFTLSSLFTRFSRSTGCSMVRMPSSRSCSLPMIDTPRCYEALNQHTENDYHGIHEYQ